MIRWGLTKQGKQRFRCAECLQTGVKKRPDTEEKNREILFERWLLKTETLERLAHLRHTKPSALVKSFSNFWHKEIEPMPYRGSGRTLIVDGIIIERDACVLIAIDGEGVPITWLSCRRENLDSWIRLFELAQRQGVKQPAVIISDAQKGLLGAMKRVFPLTPHQRCLTHVVRLTQAWLTRNPKTIAGQDLRLLVGTLYGIKTRDDALCFIKQFDAWKTKHHHFLKEMSLSPEKKRR